MIRVAIFTDNDFGKVNGVTTTLRAVLRCAPSDISVCLHTMSDRDEVTPDYISSQSVGVGLPWYRQMKIYWPRLGRLSRAFRRDDADVVHITTPGPVGLAARLLASWYRRPVVGSFHTNLGDYVRQLGGHSVIGRGVGAWLDAYMQWLYATADRVLVPSTGTRMALIEQGYDPRRLAVCARGVDATQFTPRRRSGALRRIWKVTADTPVLLYVGRLSREKGLDRLIDLDRLLTARGARFRLVCAGDGPMRSELQERLPHAVFWGEVPHAEVGELMASADVFVFPSDTDTFGNVVLEAQASGLPAVVSGVGGPREAIVDGVSGFVCATGRVDEFAERVGRLLADRELRERCAHAARQQAAARDWSETLAPLYQQWRDAVARVRMEESRRLMARPAARWS